MNNKEMWKENEFSVYSDAPGGFGLADFAEIKFNDGFAVYESVKIDRLIAQRDELLAALKETLNQAINWYDDSRGYNDGDEIGNDFLGWITRARAAITKAEAAK